ncbi:hypothetical protein J2S74_002678 [Evansella vedderi]|uniref:Ribosomal protein L32 n=1 Tax=Evansella vedderi TaxID=38282 RepID=A0ABT9ZX31_9BACI|nr:hypothetical protein [Evansella vedderi]
MLVQKWKETEIEEFVMLVENTFFELMFSQCIYIMYKLG